MKETFMLSPYMSPLKSLINVSIEIDVSSKVGFFPTLVTYKYLFPPMVVYVP